VEGTLSAEPFKDPRQHCIKEKMKQERLNGTVALVTGASSGIGAATAAALAAQGAAVALAARRKIQLDTLAASIPCLRRRVGVRSRSNRHRSRISRRASTCTATGARYSYHCPDIHRDRDKIVDHVLGAEVGYVAQLGVRGRKQPLLNDKNGVAGHRAAILEALAGTKETAWPPRYGARRIAWHVLDHAWEIEDRIPRSS